MAEQAITTETSRWRPGVWSLAALVVANMIGTGLYTTSGFAVQATGSATAVVGIWILAGLYALLGAYCY
ncbi:MAG: amino acid permease, partial [Planctomycetota bacterium]